MTKCTLTLPSSCHCVPLGFCPCSMAASRQMCSVCWEHRRLWKWCRGFGISSAEAQRGEIMTFCWCSETRGAMQTQPGTLSYIYFSKIITPIFQGLKQKAILIIPNYAAWDQFLLIKELIFKLMSWSVNSFWVQIVLQDKNMPLWIVLKSKPFLFLLIRVLKAIYIPHKRQVEGILSFSVIIIFQYPLV